MDFFFFKFGVNGLCPRPSYCFVVQSTEEYRQKRYKSICKVKKIQKIPKKSWIELIPPTHPPHPNFFGNPSLTLTEHTNHNNQQLLAIYIHTEYIRYTTPIIYISTGLGLFLKIFHEKNPSDTWTNPPTSIEISDIWNLCLFAKPQSRQ